MGAIALPFLDEPMMQLQLVVTALSVTIKQHSSPLPTTL
jgi:hypothetical protein